MASLLSPMRLVKAVGCVGVGGFVGTVLRDLILRRTNDRWFISLFGKSGWSVHVPWLLLIINALGVFVTTWLLQKPLRHHEGLSEQRLLIVTGFFGGFTSYSSLLIDLRNIWNISAFGALAVGLAAVMSGVVVAWLTVRWTNP